MELKIEHISKQFKDKTAVDDVSLTLTTGVWGLLGANGAGKTTLMRILADIMTPSSGRISLDGKDIHKWEQIIAISLAFCHKILAIPAILRSKTIWNMLLH